MDEKKIIDVRDPEKFQAEHFPGAANFPHTKIDAGQVPDLPKNTPIMLYCGTGNKAGRMKSKLEEQGFTRVSSCSLPQLKRGS